MHVKVKGTPLNVLEKQFKTFDITMQGYIERVALVARGLIAERLETHLGTSAEHFSVSIRPMPPLGYTVTIGPKDEIGVFIQEGTEPHRIVSENPMPIGNGAFVTVVNHPGTESKKDLIYLAIFEGMSAALEIAHG